MLALAGALLLLLVSLAAASPASAWTSETTFTITGRGWGHGIGMSQWGAYGYAMHGWTYDQILKHYYTGIDLGKVNNTPIRVRLRSGLTAVKLTCSQPYTAAATGAKLEIAAGVTATLTWVDGTYRVSADGKAKDFTAPVTFAPSAGLLSLTTTTDMGDAGRYRGTIRVVRYDGALMMINKLPLESYLRGVVPREVSPSWPAESLKAQACAARAYAQRSRNPSDPWDVYCTTRDQVYVGADAEDSRTDKAIRATAGVVPTYDGSVITAYYHSTSGGHTENIEKSWQTSAVPYLKGVRDAYDTYSPLHTWPAPLRKSAGTLASALGSYVNGSLRAVYPVEKGTSPRIVRAAVIGSGGTSFVHGSILRAKLDLRDTWATFKSMSISPAASDKMKLTYGAKVTLKGRVYPALTEGAAVTLRSYYGGAWHTRSVTTTRASQSLGSGYTAKYSVYSLTMKPGRTKRYYFTSGKARSPETTVTVKAAVSLTAADAEAAPGETLVFDGQVLPLRPGGTVWLQTKTGSTWTDRASAVLDDASACHFDWTAVSGVTAVRLRAPAANGVAAGYSPAVALTIQ